MSALLDGVLDAHGGLQRWRAAETVHGRVRTGGLLLRTRVPGNRFADYRITVHVQQARTVLDPFPRDGYRGVFESGQVRIESHDGAVISSRAHPRAAFFGRSGLRRNIRWDPLDSVYFAGYAMWNYLTTPYLLTREGVAVEEGAPWQQEGETWRRLIVSFPPDIDTHSPRQTFYVDASGLLRRHDYVPEVVGHWARAAHYCADPVDVDGFVFVAVVVALAGGLGIALAHPWRSSGPRTSAPPPPPPADAVELRVLNDGVFVGSSVAPTTIDIFNEPICPPCGSFIRSYASDIDTAVADKQLAVRYHLLNFLDDQSHSKNYSTRAVAASYCVAGQNDPKLYASFYSALFGSDFQPQENAASDRTDAELAHLAQTVGAEPTAISCIKSGADLGTAQTKATNASETLAGFNASGTPFVWDGSMVVNYQDPSWLARLIG